MANALQLENDDNQISDNEFHAISRLVYKNFGIVLGEEKRSLVVGRLHGCLSKRKISSFSQYLNLIKSDMTGEILSELVNQISTNFTSFYREASHFEYLADKALPEVMKMLSSRRSNDLRIWCAACSSGEEAYTIQMTVMKKLGLQYGTMNAGLLATDISAKVLDLAKAATYTAEQVATVHPDLKKSYFKVLPDGRHEVKPNVRDQILFRRFNLMNETFPFKTPFQIIFCRNVMIYFDEETRKKLIGKFYELLEPGGYLFIGHSETVPLDCTRFKAILPAVYRKPF
ncbi:MAG: protein-glutamate O-methyltransferase CheR [Proteobacteria bacterium]|nr:MAG: protein-glutamate O-methyltransferase CheR [Pseudomonadota bacterium]